MGAKGAAFTRFGYQSDIRIILQSLGGLMSDNPHKSLIDDAPGTHPLHLLIRIALIATYPLLAVSILAFIGLSFGGAFVAQFSIENKTDKTIFVTPVGTVGGEGNRHPLRVYMWPFPPISSAQRGGFEVPPNKSVAIIYDMDDINFSEIVVHDHGGERGQLVANPNPTQNQYHPPTKKHFVVDDLDSLVPVPGPVRKAAREAQLPTIAPWIEAGVLVVPWVAFAVLSWLDRSWGKSNAGRKRVVSGT
ncbi:MAG: hypothetical protein GXP27_00685 [Planctomycetes bacterium]|nr:hypothetical protein [Planctomycetota bacterium]